MVVKEIFNSLRPQQWIKNFFIFAALIFSQNIFTLSLVAKTIVAFVSFCVISSALYILNDLKDIEEDKLHPVKSKRPLASGRLKRSHAILSFFVLSALAFILAVTLNINFLMVTLVYFILQITYSFWL